MIMETKLDMSLPCNMAAKKVKLIWAKDIRSQTMEVIDPQHMALVQGHLWYLIMGTTLPKKIETDGKLFREDQ